jgi:cation:H+ antiporter
MLIALLQLVPGLVILFVGGHYLVQGSTGIALLARISTAVVALTVVAMGTSLPELAVSLNAAARGATDLAYGNIVGSCVFNIGAILGIAALLGPIAVRHTTAWIEYAIMFFVTAMVLVLARDRWIDRPDGLFLVVSLVLFLTYTVYLAKKGVTLSEAAALKREVERTAHIEGGLGLAWGKNVAYVVGGIAALVIGAHLSVAGGVTIARLLDVEERIIGLTVIAMGTSLPELATSIVAARRGEQEIALGNIIGSNIFNLLAILGITASIFPVPVNEHAASLDNWVMLGFTIALFPMMMTGRRISRANAFLLLAAFASYMSYLVIVR